MNTVYLDKNYFIKKLLKYWPCLLVLLAFIGFISKSLYNYPIGLMAILGLYRLLVSPTIIFKDPVLKIFSFSFLCLWLPLLISFPDSVNPQHSAHTIFPYLRFYFAGIFIIHELSKDTDRIKFILTGIFILVLFWSIDACIQFGFGMNLLGFPYEEFHITGMFYPRNTISHICSILSVFMFLYVYLNIGKNKWVILSVLPLFFILLLSGRRAAWIMMALSVFGFIVYSYIYTNNKRLFIKIIGILSVIIALILSTTIIYHEPTHNRFKVTMGLFSGNYESINNATAKRLPIWDTAYSIFIENPINGIGPRGFRHVYKEYAKPDDYFVKVNDIPTQPHLLILEILAETGLIGAAGYLLIFFFIFKVFIRSSNKEALLPFLIPCLIALFPFNAHMAIYGSIWSSMIWLLLILYFSYARGISINKAFNYK